MSYIWDMEQNKPTTYFGYEQQFKAAFDLYLTYNDAIHQCHDIAGGQGMMETLRKQSKTWRDAWQTLECQMIDNFGHTYADTIRLQNQVYNRRNTVA